MTRPSSPKPSSSEPSAPEPPASQSSVRKTAARKTSTKQAPAKQPAELPAGWLSFGTIVGAQGLKGELRVYPETDFPERLETPGQRWILYPGQTEPQTIELKTGVYHGRGLYVIQLAGIRDRNQAEALRGCRLLVLESDRPPLEENEYHVSDLIGLTVWQQGDPLVEVGRVSDVLSAGNDLLQVQLTGGESGDRSVLIPFVPEIVPVVDVAAGRIEINPPAGLLDLS